MNAIINQASLYMSMPTLWSGMWPFLLVSPHRDLWIHSWVGEVFHYDWTFQLLKLPGSTRNAKKGSGYCLPTMKSARLEPLENRYLDSVKCTMFINVGSAILLTSFCKYCIMLMPHKTAYTFYYCKCWFNLF